MMRQVLLSDKVYERAIERAKAAGFANVDDYICSVLDDNEFEVVETPDLDHLFTPERLAVIDQSLAAVKAGERTYTLDEVEQHLAETRDEWIRQHNM